MIKNVSGNIFESDANFILCNANYQGLMNSGIAIQVSDNYFHIEKELRKYINHYNKADVDIFGSVQYVPTEIWAIGMVDTIKNNDVIDYDSNYQYIVNMFFQEDCGHGKQHTDLKAFKKALLDVRDKSEKIKATVAIPYKLGCHKTSAQWEDIYTIIKKVFEKSNVDVEIWRYN